MAWLRSLFFSNFLLKLFAMILAVTLYVQIHKDTLVRVTTVDVKLILQYPRDLILTSGPIPTLKVTLQGPDSVLKRSATRNWRFTLNLSDAMPGSMQTELYTEQLRKIFPVELRVIRVQPSLLDLTFAKLAKRTLPIHVPTRGEPLFGYRLIQIQPFPRVVAVEGPASVIDSLKHIPTSPIDLRGKYRDQTVLVTLHKPDKNIRFVGPHKTKVSLTFLQRKIKRTIKQVPVQLLHFLNAKMDTKLSPATADVTLIGPQAQLQPLKGKDLILTVDGSKIVNKKAGTYKLPLAAKAPNTELKVLKIEPSEVSLTMTARPGQTSPAPRKQPPPRSREDKDSDSDDDDEKSDGTSKNKRLRSRKRRKYRRRKKRIKHKKRVKRRRTHRVKKRRIRKRLTRRRKPVEKVDVRKRRKPQRRVAHRREPAKSRRLEQLPRKTARAKASPPSRSPGLPRRPSLAPARRKVDKRSAAERSTKN